MIASAARASLTMTRGTGEGACPPLDTIAAAPFASAESMNFNYLSGQTVTVSLPATPRSPTYTLQGPGINAAESVVPRAEGQGELSLTQPVMPGNYTLRGAEGDWRRRRRARLTWSPKSMKPDACNSCW